LLYPIFISVLLATYIIITLKIYSWNKEAAFEEISLPNTLKERVICMAIAVIWPILPVFAVLQILSRKVASIFNKEK